jgi:tRNA threonylcarbamoyladenosine biosynthesis protein TsaE
MKFERDISSLEQLPLVAKELLETFANNRIFLFDAQMGMGKTTFIKELCKQLGSAANFSSPTYSIVNEYPSPKNKIFHFDLYRLKNSSELFDIGFEDYIADKAYCFIEWPELALPFLEGENYVQVIINLTLGKRLLQAQNN